MPKKSAKAMTNYADRELCVEIYGVGQGDYVVTPLGVEVQVVGMDKTSGSLYVEFSGSYISPLSPKSKEDMERDGYRQDKKTTYETIVKQNKATAEKLNNTQSPLMATTVLMENERTSSDMVKEYFLKTLVEREKEGGEKKEKTKDKSDKKKAGGKKKA